MKSHAVSYKNCFTHMHAFPNANTNTFNFNYAWSYSTVLSAAEFKLFKMGVSYKFEHIQWCLSSNINAQSDRKRGLEGKNKAEHSRVAPVACVRAACGHT